MSGIEDLVRKFDDFENSMKTVLPKVDTRLIIDMLHRIKRDESPMYTIEIFLDKRPDEEKIRSPHAVPD